MCKQNKAIPKFILATGLLELNQEGIVGTKKVISIEELVGF